MIWNLFQKTSLIMLVKTEVPVGLPWASEITALPQAWAVTQL